MPHAVNNRGIVDVPYCAGYVAMRSAAKCLATAQSVRQSPMAPVDVRQAACQASETVMGFAVSRRFVFAAGWG